MDVDSTTAQELTHLGFMDQDAIESGSHYSERPPECGLCGRTTSLVDDMNGSHQNVGVCDDCKFLLLEDSGMQVRNSHNRRMPGRSRSINGSSEFSEQFSQLVNLARHDEPGHEEIPGDASSHLRFLQSASSHTMPHGSSRWRRITSDTDSDVSNSDSYYGESESNISFGGYYHGNSDAVSFSTYEGDSDASVDGQTLFDTDIFAQSVERSDFDSDSDIDPMHAGDVQWDFNDREMADGEWEEVDTEQITAGSSEAGAHIATSRAPLIRRRTDSRDSVGRFNQRVTEVGFVIPRIHIGVEEQSNVPFLGDPGDYLDAPDLELFLQHLAETDGTRRGAPPASASFVNNLPLIIINKEHQKPDDLACAICKELLTMGAEVNELPCLHLYHPTCILPWLSSRNSCPLCRFELPTDDMDYEQAKSHRMFFSDSQLQAGRDDDSTISVPSEIDEDQELWGSENVSPTAGLSSRRAGWFLFAAAPVVSFVGIVFLLWSGIPLAGGQRQNGRSDLHCHPPLNSHTSGSCPGNQREKRWWWF